MKRKITLMAAAALIGCGLRAQTVCSDLNGFVNYKNVGPTGSYSLQIGAEELAGQTYHYSGPGKISSVRIYGTYPGAVGGVPLKISVCNVDNSGRPTTTIQSVNATWWTFDNTAGYINVYFPGSGITVNNNFAVTAQVLNSFPFGNTFNLRYTGDGEGLNQDLASLAGTSTGFNWTSAKNNFNKDGDFYIVPKMSHFITSSFSVSSLCANAGSPVSFVNTTAMTRDSMFNRIGLYGYQGSAKYYTWNFGDGSPASYSISPAHTYSLPGVYTVSLTSTIDGWTTLCSNTYTAKISVGLSAYAASLTNVSCYGSSNGNIVAVGQGGAPTYSYSINGINYQASPNFSGLGAGNYNLYIKDMLGCVNSSSFSITQPSAISFTSASTTNASCGNADGSLLVGASGGAGNIQYRINNGSYQVSGSFNNLSAGIYTVTAKDVNACTTVTYIPVNDAGGPSITSVNSTQVSCNGGNDGSISITATGGTGNILYSINGGVTFQNGNSFSGLNSGIYAIMIKDAVNCTDLSTLTISQPQALIVNVSSNAAACYGTNTGSINIISSSGGTGLHNYSINGVNYQSGNIFPGVAAGTYTVYVKDVANCIGTTTITVTQPSALTALVSSSATSCFASNNGVISIGANGGIPNYSYSLNGIVFQPSGIFSDLLAGAYTITVKDFNNCSFTTAVTVNQPAIITSTVGSTNSTCGNANGGILVIGGGGAGGFQYSMNGVNFNGTGSFSPLASGTYYVIIQDQTGCQKIVPATVVDSNGPSILGQSSTNISCNGGNNGSISITNVTGGAGILHYSINGVNWQVSPTFTSLPAGNYVVTVKDANNCTGTTTATLTQPNPFVINPIVLNAQCNASAGSATIAAAGGAGILAYSINDGLTWQASNVFNPLVAGLYNVMVKDGANCIGSTNFVISEPPAINISLGILDVPCNGLQNGAITVNASGGTGSLLYSINGITYSPSNVFSNLSGNFTYIISVKDGNNCVRTQSAYVSQPAPLTVMPVQSNITCAGGNNGAINLSVAGGVYPYSFQWSTGQTSQGIFNLTAGAYSVVVTDYNGCYTVHNMTITQPANPLVVNAAITNPTGPGANNGAIDITVTGGTGPYSYSWSNGSITEDLSNLPAGAYLVTVTDANGCVTSSTFYVGNITGIAGVQMNAADILLYPNPGKEFVKVETKGLIADKLEVINLLGQKLMEIQSNSSVTEINTVNLAPGTYFVKIYANDKVYSKRMTIAN